MFQPLKLSSAMLLILAEVITAAASSPSSLSAAGNVGVIDFAMPGNTTAFETVCTVRRYRKTILPLYQSK